MDNIHDDLAPDPTYGVTNRELVIILAVFAVGALALVGLLAGAVWWLVS